MKQTEGQLWAKLAALVEEFRSAARKPKPIRMEPPKSKAEWRRAFRKVAKRGALRGEGWIELVWAWLKSRHDLHAEFTTASVYPAGKALLATHPTNTFTDEKIRQTLRILVTRGYLRVAKWRSERGVYAMMQ